MKNRPTAPRVLSTFVVLALAHSSFAPSAWSQVASVGNVAAPVGGSVGGAFNANGASAVSNGPTLSLSGASLDGTLKAASVVPTVSELATVGARTSFGGASAVAVPTALTLSKDAPAASAAASAALVETPIAGAPRTVPAAFKPAALAVATPAASKSDVPNGSSKVDAGKNTSKVRALIAGVLAAFGKKDAPSSEAKDAAPVALTGTVPAAHTSDLSPAEADGHEKTDGSKDEPPVPPAAPNGNDGGGKSYFGLGKAAFFFIGSLVVAQIGVEALGAAMPALVQKTFGDFTVVAQLGIFASIASIVGRQVGPMAVQKWGLRKTYLVGTATRIVSISILCALLATGHMTLPLMMAFYCVNGLIGGVTGTAEASIPPALMGSDQAKIEKFWTWEQTLLEIIGVTGPIVTGAVVTSMGFLPALIAFPLTFAIALAILFVTLKIPQKVEAMRLADLNKPKDPSKPAGVKGAFSQFFHRIAEGAKLVWHDPLLKTSFLAYTVYMMLNPFLYSMIGPAFGIRLVGADHMAAVYGLLTGLYSLGGLLGGFLMIREQNKLNKAKAAGMTEAQESEALRQSMLKWMKWGTVGLLAILSLAFPLAPLGTFLTLPGFLSWAGALTLPALALIPFGIAQVIATVKLKSYFQSKVPAGRMPDAMGFFGSASLLVSTIGLLGLKYLFKGVSGFTPFWIIAGLMIPLAVYYVYLTRTLNKQSAPPTDSK